jgi:hypothetical protein
MFERRKLSIDRSNVVKSYHAVQAGGLARIAAAMGWCAKAGEPLFVLATSSRARMSRNPIQFDFKGSGGVE